MQRFATMNMLRKMQWRMHCNIQSGSHLSFPFIPSSITKQNYGPEVYKELPEDWLKGLNIKKQVASPNYDENVNKYKVKCGGSLEMWETSGWIVEQDPYGWFQWYCRFFQVQRWKLRAASSFMSGQRISVFRGKQ